jgi:hypothetical protein
VALFIYKEEEDRDSVAIQLILKKFNRLFKYLFSKYSATGHNTKNFNIADIDEIMKRKETINLPELYTMLKDHGVSSKIISKNNL